MDNWGDKIIWNNTLRDWIISIAIITFAFLVLRLLKSIVIKKVKAFSLRTKTTIDDFIIAVIQS